MDGRYIRNIPALTPGECALLRNKRVFVAGCGGLGGYIIELLLRVGIGALTVADSDVFDETNLNRQLLCLEEYIGRNKAETAVLRAARINPETVVTAVTERITQKNAARLITGCDLVMDALDSAEDRLVLARASTGEGIYLVHGAISGWQIQALSAAPGSGVIEKLYSHMPPAEPEIRGSLGFAASLCASIQVSEAVKLLCGRLPALDGKLLLLDIADMELTMLEI